jgi:ADP-ribosylglycohydrolase
MLLGMERSERAWRSLAGLSVGDAFGERFFGSAAVLVASRALPAPPWRWTDDTAMALGVVEVLEEHGRIDPDRLALVFARRWSQEPLRGYGGGAHRILEAIHLGAPWRIASADAFGGQGSKGNGGAMRAAPLGAWFADDLDAVVSEARASAEVTHAHPEGIAGAIAVAVAAAGAHRGVRGAVLLELVWARTPDGETRDRLAIALALPPGTGVVEAVGLLGNGSDVTAPDTVPFSLWSAAHHLGDFREAMWQTVSGLGDRDTTCAIAGGVVAAAGTPIPEEWLAAREPLAIASGAGG